ncbi:hypothetical protein [Bacillus wiedmannii]|uniref:hypothetical protein n=1 Tax=Bacillus wiedmannii TaxID=1890302 RepID=UPI000D03D305|nr:hypothetical protein [Bacillus wiedmannii]PRT33996.1 hypothetical protein C6358_06765 [Bacillus wiedmannii]
MIQWISNSEKFGLKFALSAMFIGIFILTLLGGNKIKLDIIVAIIVFVIAVEVLSSSSAV